LLARGESGIVSFANRTGGQDAFPASPASAQRLGMGQELHETYPAFAGTFDAAVSELDRRLPRSLET